MALTHLERREIGDIVAVRPLSNLERRRCAVTYSFTDSFARVGCLALHRYTGPDAHEDKRVQYAHTARMRYATHRLQWTLSVLQCRGPPTRAYGIRRTRSLRRRGSDRTSTGMGYHQRRRAAAGGLRALQNLPGALSSALERGSASKSRMVSLYTSTCATEHSAAVTTHTTLWRKCGHEGFDRWRNPRGTAEATQKGSYRRAPNHRDDDLAVILLLARFAYLRTERAVCRPSTAAAGLRTDTACYQSDTTRCEMQCRSGMHSHAVPCRAVPGPEPHGMPREHSQATN